jgi:hypothetical protein
VEPPRAQVLPRWTKNNPDFLLISQTGDEILVEAASVFPIHEFGGEKQRFQELINSINKSLNSPDFWVGVIVNASTSQRPPLNRICKYLERELSKLRYEEVKEHFDKSKDFPRIPWKNGEWDLEFRISTKNQARGNPDIGSLGLYTEGIKEVHTISDIQSSIKRKNDHYGDLTIPYLLALNIHAHVDDLAVPDALLGIPMRQGRRVLWVSDGSWYRRKEYHMQRMSGLCTFSGLCPDNLNWVNPILWHHPDPTYSIPPQLWKLSQNIFNGMSMDYQQVDGEKIGQLLGVYDDKMSWD